MYRFHYTIIATVLVFCISCQSDQIAENEMFQDFDSSQIEIQLDVWPKILYYGDYYFVSFTVKNLSLNAVSISPHDLFENWGYHGNNKVAFPGVPEACLVRNTSFGINTPFQEGLSVDLGYSSIPPREERIVCIAQFLADFKGQSAEWKKLENGPGTYDINIVNFSEKVKNRVVQPLPAFQVKARPLREEERIIENFLHANNDVYGFNEIETKSGVFDINQVFYADQFSELSYTPERNLRNLSQWVEFEKSLTPGTFRDEIRLARMQVQYLDTKDDKILKELSDWFTKMPDIQRITYAANLCLPLPPKGQSIDKFLDILVYREGGETQRNFSNKRKSYFNMRKKFEETTTMYNILPQRFFQKPSY